jgi:hypothetical protein
MSIYRMIDSMTRYISEAVTRIFGPSDDAYPATGVQPFTGEPFKPQRHTDW